jgi:hypothetical protein
MATQTKDLWSLVKGRPYVDAAELAEAIEAQAVEPRLDFRTRLLIRDGLEALQTYWGRERLVSWLDDSPAKSTLYALWREPLGAPGFPALAERIVDKTEAEDIRRFLRSLGERVHRTVRMEVGGSAALILPGLLVKKTDDVDVVDEVPAEVRSLHPLLRELKKRYGLGITHFQPHYLPSGWEHRLHSQEPFGKLQVYLVDPYDVVLSKLFSDREKDKDDLQAVVDRLDRETLKRRVRETTAPLRKDARARRAAEQTWHILFGEALPS